MADNRSRVRDFLAAASAGQKKRAYKAASPEKRKLMEEEGFTPPPEVATPSTRQQLHERSKNRNKGN